MAWSYHNTVLSGKLRVFSSSSSLLTEAALPSQEAPSASASPTSPTCWPLSQRSIGLVIWARISWALRTPNVFIRTTWAKTRGLFEFQLLPRTPRHSAAKIAVNRRPTAPEGVAYQLSD